MLCLYGEPQWAVVGDTFPVGCAYSDQIVFPEFFAANPDSKVPEYQPVRRLSAQLRFRQGSLVVGPRRIHLPGDAQIFAGRSALYVMFTNIRTTWISKTSAVKLAGFSAQTRARPVGMTTATVACSGAWTHLRNLSQSRSGAPNGSCLPNPQRAPSSPVVAVQTPKRLGLRRMIAVAVNGWGDIDFRRFALGLLLAPFPDVAFPRLRASIHRLLGIRIGRSTLIRGRLTLTGPPGCTSRLTIGSYCFFTTPLHIDLNSDVVIGNRVTIGHDVAIVTSAHLVGEPDRRCGKQVPAPVRIGDGCWIGAHVLLLPGVVLGDGSIIAAGAVVSSNVEPHTIVGGSAHGASRSPSLCSAVGARRISRREISEHITNNGCRKADANAVSGLDLRSGAYRSRALGRRLLGRLEQPFQTEEPLLEELVAQIGHGQRGGHA